MELEFFKDEYRITTDKSEIQLQNVHDFLRKESYWAKDIPLEVLKKSIENSLTFSVFHNGDQIGFARVITDYSTFAYVSDVFIVTEYRKKGLSKWLLECILQIEALQGLRRWMLMTLDAQQLYKKVGFSNLKFPERAMEINNTEI